MHILHISAECYPVAKAGGLADVVGSLPRYQRQSGVDSWVVMPAYRTPFVEQHRFEVVHRGFARLGGSWFEYRILREETDTLGFPLYLVDIPGLLDRSAIYGHADDFERWAAFQIAVLEWVRSFERKPDLIHAHDHHAALIPFLMTACPEYEALVGIPTVLTLHNGEYHGEYDLGKRFALPWFHPEKAGLLDWGGRFNALSCGLRTCWKFTTVSPTYLKELTQGANGLEHLIRAEWGKGSGILNGIDTEIWNPETDPLIAERFGAKNLAKGKAANKKALCKEFALDPGLPTFVFIGRLVREKGADLLPDLIGTFLAEHEGKANAIVLGTGDPELHHRLSHMSRAHVGYFDASLQYNERLSHQMYAGADFLLMPSRVEPCGLNQMYALRYGTIPIVRDVGGLHDTVVDIGEEGGNGIRFTHFSLEDALHAMGRAYDLYEDASAMAKLRKRAMAQDFSWDRSATAYIDLYRSLCRT